MQTAQARLAQEVLAEIPDQFLSYMKKMKIAPGSWHSASNKPPVGHLPASAPSTAQATQMWGQTVPPMPLQA